jgi:TonB family protein
MHRLVLAITAALVGAMSGPSAAAPAQEEIWVPGASESEDGARLLNLGELVTPDDYPSQSVVADEQGTVGVSVKVDAAGRVADCMVEISSGFAALDAQTCRLFWLRAKFEPDHDADGKAVPSVYRRKITWRLEGQGMPLEAWAHTLIVIPSLKGNRCAASLSKVR